MKPRVVALHGFLGRGADWDAVRAATSHAAEWICPNLFSPSTDDWNVAQNQDSKAWLAGYSLGGRLALRWLVEEPERWHGALLLSVNPGNFQSDAERQSRRIADAAWAQVFRNEEWYSLMRRWNAQSVLLGKKPPQRHEADFDRNKLAAALEHFSVADQSTDPSRLTMPLLWMCGERDQKFSSLLHSLRVANFPGAFQIVPDAGHRLLHEAPNAVATALDLLMA